MRIFYKNKGFTLVELMFVFMAVAFVFVLMVPIIRTVHDYKTRSMCADNVRQIGRAMYIYAQEHDGKFPPDMETLYSEKYLTNEDFLDCPANQDKGNLKKPDFFYTGGLSVNSPSLAPLVRDKEGNHPTRGKNVLYVNGNVGWEE